MANNKLALTPKQELFILEYLKDLNGSQAAIRAGYSAKTANRIANENLTKLVIRQRIDAAILERAERTKVDADYVLDQLRQVWESDIADILTEDGKFKPIREWPVIWRRMIGGIDVEELLVGVGQDREKFGQTVKAKIMERFKALELIGKHVSVRAFADRHEHTGKDGAPLPGVSLNVSYHIDMKPDEEPD